MLEKIKQNRLLAYIVLTLLISYLYAGLYYIAGGRLNGIIGTIFSASYMFIPMCVGFFLTRYVYKEKLLILGTKWNVRNSWKWYLIAWLSPLILNLVVILVSIGFPGVSFTLGMEGIFHRYSDVLTSEQLTLMKEQLSQIPPIVFLFTTLIQSLVAGVTINMLAAFGEEAGWRGFMYKQVEKWNFWKAALFTGFIWGIWHMPFILQGYNYPEHPVLGVFMMIFFTLGLSPLMHLIRQKTDSIWSAAIFHGTINASVGIGLLYIVGGSDILIGLLGFSGVILLGVVNLSIYLLQKNKII